MKPINSRERSKQLWQFVFIFFALAVIPVALIFFSYYRLPEKISESEERKLIRYTYFEHTQKLISSRMDEMDSMIKVYSGSKTENPRMLEKHIIDGIEELKKMDTSFRMVQLISVGYENHYNDVVKLLEVQKKADDVSLKLNECQEQRKALSNQMGAYPPAGSIPQ